LINIIYNEDFGASGSTSVVADKEDRGLGVEAKAREPRLPDDQLLAHGLVPVLAQIEDVHLRGSRRHVYMYIYVYLYI